MSVNQPIQADPYPIGFAMNRITGIAGALENVYSDLETVLGTTSSVNIWVGRGAQHFASNGQILIADVDRGVEAFNYALSALQRVQLAMTSFNSQNIANATQVATLEAEIAAVKTQIANPTSTAVLPALHQQFDSLSTQLADLQKAGQNTADELDAALRQAASSMDAAAQMAPKRQWRQAALPRQRLSNPAPVDPNHPLAPEAGVLFSGKPRASQIHEGFEVGDCYLLASVGAIAITHPSWLRKRVVDKGNGIYAVTLFIKGKSRTYEVDASLPPDSGGDIPTISASGAPVLWPAIVEKAYAKAMGGYPVMDHGMHVADALSTLTGQPVSTQLSSAGPSGMASFLTGSVHSGSPTVLTAALNLPVGSTLVANHAYYLESYDPNTGMVQVGNPWGFSNPPPMTVSQVCQSFWGAQSAVAGAVAPTGSVG